MQNERNPSWSQKEKAMAISLINENYDDVFRRFKGATFDGFMKIKKWQEIAEKLNG